MTIVGGTVVQINLIGNTERIRTFDVELVGG
jgi:hypothetical protein